MNFKFIIICTLNLKMIWTSQKKVELPDDFQTGHHRNSSAIDQTKSKDSTPLPDEKSLNKSIADKVIVLETTQVNSSTAPEKTKSISAEEQFQLKSIFAKYKKQKSI